MQFSKLAEIKNHGMKINFYSLVATLVLLSVSIGANAQKTIVSKAGLTVTSSSIKSSKQDPFYSYVDAVGEDEMIVKCEVKDEPVLIRMSRDFDELETITRESKEIPVKEVPKVRGKGISQYVITYKGRHFLLKGTSDRDKLKNVFTQTEVDEEGEPIGDPFEVAKVVGEEFYSNPGNADFGATESEDGSKLLVYIKLPEQREGDARRHTIYKYFVYDEDMNLLWSHIQEYKHKGGRVIHHGYNTNRVFENDGSVTAWAILDRGRKTDPRFAIRFYSINGDDVVTSEVNLKKKMDFWTTSHRGDRTYLIAPYGIDKGEGIRMLIWDSKEKEARIEYIEYGSKHLVKNQPEKEIKRIESLTKKGKPTFAIKYALDRIIEMPDGGFIITGQEGFNKEISTSKYSSFTEYHRFDYHLFGIDAEGKLEWSEIIPLNQRTTGTDFGCIVKPVKNRVYAIFSDTDKNFEPEWNPAEGAKLYKGNKEVVGMVVVDTENPRAAQKRHRLWGFDKLQGWLTTTSFVSTTGIPTGAAKVYVPKDKQRLLWFDFE